LGGENETARQACAKNVFVMGGHARFAPVTVWSQPSNPFWFGEDEDGCLLFRIFRPSICIIIDDWILDLRNNSLLA
jgi:hypothetical protein